METPVAQISVPAKPDPVSCHEFDGEVRDKRQLYVAFAILTAAMLAFSQTLSCYWDEGFHVLAARLIDLGKRPYLDFLFPQTPLNAYWNAAWMGIFGPSWRVLHGVATLATVGAVALIMTYLFTVFPDRRWKSAAAFTGLSLFGLHTIVWDDGTVAQAYALCLLLLVAAFRAAVVGVRKQGTAASLLTGFFAGAAAASSLLTAPAAPVLLVWMWVCNRAGNRWAKALAFVAGGAAPCIPIAILFVRSPRQTWFNIVKYQALYRNAGWDGATGHDIGVVTDWLNRSPDLLIVLLAVAGLFFLKSSGLDSSRRAEIYLSVCLALGLGAQNMLAHPTFSMYFVFMVPFLTVPAAFGFYSVVMRFRDPISPRAAALGIVGVMALCLGNEIYDAHGYYTWPELEEVAVKVKQVTPSGAPLLAPEQIYFLAHWPVPTGMEFHHGLRLDLPPAESALYHLVSKAHADQQVKSGAFATTVLCDDPDQARAVKDWKVYAQTAELEDCDIFWQVAKPVQEAPGGSPRK